jgi:hypothetical protein
MMLSVGNKGLRLLFSAVCTQQNTSVYTRTPLRRVRDALRNETWGKVHQPFVIQYETQPPEFGEE